MWKLRIILFFLLGCPFSIKAQKPFLLELKGLAQVPSSFRKYTHRFSDSAARGKEVRRIVDKMQERGYLELGIDSIRQKGAEQIVFIHTGEVYVWDAVVLQGDRTSMKNLPVALQAGAPASKSAVNAYVEDNLQALENAGFPFAKMGVGYELAAANRLKVTILLDKGPLIRIDTLRMIPTAPVHTQFLQPYLGLKKGKIYGEDLVKAIDRRLRAIEFLTLNRSGQVLFKEDKASFNLFLTKKNANTFDGLIGLQPKNDGSGRVNLTGDMQLRLLNSFKRGEELYVKFKALPMATQQLQVKAAYPYVLHSPIGIEVQLDLFKQDTQFVDVGRELALSYLLLGGNYVKGFIRNRTSSLLSVSGLENSTVLPAFADINILFYGLAYRYANTDRLINPRKGIVLYAEAAAGRKKISKNNAINPLAYEGLDLLSEQYRYFTKIQYYMPLKKRSVLLLRAEAAGIETPHAFLNDLFRIGGNSSLRGFDEQSILASRYGIASAEYRFLLEDESFLFAFYDQGYYQKNLQGESLSDNPFGFGAGLSIATKAGIFSISYAIGKQFKNPIDLQGGKVHFGIVNRF